MNTAVTEFIRGSFQIYMEFMYMDGAQTRQGVFTSKVKSVSRKTQASNPTENKQEHDPCTQYF